MGGKLNSQKFPGQCLDLMGKTMAGEPLGLYPCHGQRGSQAFAMDREGLLRIPTLDYAMCVVAQKSKAVIGGCDGAFDDSEKLQWSWRPESAMLASEGGGCLAATSLKSGASVLGVAPCREKAAGQRWSWT